MVRSVKIASTHKCVSLCISCALKGLRRSDCIRSLQRTRLYIRIMLTKVQCALFKLILLENMHIRSGNEVENNKTLCNATLGE